MFPDTGSDIAVHKECIGKQPNNGSRGKSKASKVMFILTQFFLIRSVICFHRNTIIQAINIEMFWKIQFGFFFSSSYFVFYNLLVRIDQKVYNEEIKPNHTNG